MDDKQRDQFVDELLDASLRHYQSEEPRAGLEGRILANVQSAEGRARRARWAWVAVSTAMIAVMVSVLLLRSPRDRDEQVTASTCQPEVMRSVAPKIVTPAPPVVPTKRATRACRPPARPKRPEQFPTPAPLSEQEKLLLLYVNRVSESDSGPEPDGQEIEPIPIREVEIAAIDITPLPAD